MNRDYWEARSDVKEEGGPNMGVTRGKQAVAAETGVKERDIYQVTRVIDCEEMDRKKDGDKVFF